MSQGCASGKRCRVAPTTVPLGRPPLLWHSQTPPAWASSPVMSTTGSTSTTARAACSTTTTTAATSARSRTPVGTVRGATIFFSDDSGATWSHGFSLDHNCSENPTILVGKPRISSHHRLPEAWSTCAGTTSAPASPEPGARARCVRRASTGVSPGWGSSSRMTLDCRPHHESPRRLRRPVQGPIQSLPAVCPRGLLERGERRPAASRRHARDRGLVRRQHVSEREQRRGKDLDRSGTRFRAGGTLRADSAGNLYKFRERARPSSCPPPPMAA